MIHPSFERFGWARRNNPDRSPPYRVSNEKKSIFDHSKGAETVFALVLSIVNPVNHEWIGKRVARLFEGHLVSPSIDLSLYIVPFEIIGFHDIRATRNRQGCGRIQRAAFASPASASPL